MAYKKRLSKLVMLAAASAAFSALQGPVFADDPSQMQNNMARATQPMSPEEQAFCNKLNASARQMFQNMTKEQRTMCMKMPMHECKGQNACKGQGGCKTSNQGCGGQNACKGQGGCSIDANKAIKMVCDKMVNKRLAVM